MSEFRTYVRIKIKGNTKIIQNFHRKLVCFKQNVKILLKYLFYSPYFGQKVKELNLIFFKAIVRLNVPQTVGG